MKSQRNVNISIKGNLVRELCKDEYSLNGASCLLYVAKENSIIISDSGNNRLLKLSLLNEKIEEFANRFEFKYPTGLALYRNKFILVCDTGNHRIKKVSLDGEESESFAGSGICGDTVGADSECRFNSPTGVCTRNEEVFICDTKNHRLKRVFKNEVEIISGKTVGYEDGPRGQSKFNLPVQIIVDYNDLGFLIVDKGNHVIRKLSSDLSRVKTFAGSPSNHFISMLSSTRSKKIVHNGLKEECSFDKPSSIFMTKEGDIFICDSGNGCIRCVSIHSPEIITNVTIRKSNVRQTKKIISNRFDKPVKIELDFPLDVVIIGTGRNRKTIILDKDRIIEIGNKPDNSKSASLSTSKHEKQSSVSLSQRIPKKSRYEEVFDMFSSNDDKLKPIFKYYSEANRKGSTPIGMSSVNYIRFCREFNIPKIEEQDSRIIDETTGFEIIFKTIVGNNKCRMDYDDFLLSIVVIAEKLYFIRVEEYNLSDNDFESFFDRFLSKYLINSFQPQITEKSGLSTSFFLKEDVQKNDDEDEEEEERIISKLPRELKNFINQYKNVFNKIFSYYSKTKLLKSELKTAEEMCTGFRSINLEEYIQFLRDFDMIPHLINFRNAINVYERNIIDKKKNRNNRSSSSSSSLTVKEEGNLDFNRFLQSLVEISEIGFKRISDHRNLQLNTLTKQFKMLCFQMNQSRGKTLFSDSLGSHMFRGLINPFPKLLDKPSSRLNEKKSSSGGNLRRKKKSSILSSSRYFSEKSISSLSTPEFKRRKKMLKLSRNRSNRSVSHLHHHDDGEEELDISLSDVSHIQRKQHLEKKEEKESRLEIHPPVEKTVVAECVNVSLFYRLNNEWVLLYPGSVKILTRNNNTTTVYEIRFTVRRKKSPKDEILKIMAEMENCEKFHIILTPKIVSSILNNKKDEEEDNIFHIFPKGSFGVDKKSAIRFPSSSSSGTFRKIYQQILLEDEQQQKEIKNEKQEEQEEVEGEEEEEEDDDDDISTIEDLVSPISKVKRKKIVIGDNNGNIRLNFTENSIMETMKDLDDNNNKKKEEESKDEIDYFEKILCIFMTNLMKNQPNLLNEVQRRITWAKEIFQYRIPLDMEQLKRDFESVNKNGNDGDDDNDEDDAKSEKDLKKNNNRLLRAFVNLDSNIRFAFTTPFNYFQSLRKLMLENEKFLSQLYIHDSLGSPILVKSNHFCCSLNNSGGGMMFPLEVRINFVGKLFDGGNIQSVKIVLPREFDEMLDKLKLKNEQQKKNKMKKNENDYDDEDLLDDGEMSEDLGIDEFSSDEEDSDDEYIPGKKKKKKKKKKMKKKKTTVDTEKKLFGKMGNTRNVFNEITEFLYGSFYRRFSRGFDVSCHDMVLAIRSMSTFTPSTFSSSASSSSSNQNSLSRFSKNFMNIMKMLLVPKSAGLEQKEFIKIAIRLARQDQVSVLSHAKIVMNQKEVKKKKGGFHYVHIQTPGQISKSVFSSLVLFLLEIQPTNENETVETLVSSVNISSNLAFITFAKKHPTHSVMDQAFQQASLKLKLGGGVRDGRSGDGFGMVEIHPDKIRNFMEIVTYHVNKIQEILFRRGIKIERGTLNLDEEEEGKDDEDEDYKPNFVLKKKSDVVVLSPPPLERRRRSERVVGEKSKREEVEIDDDDDNNNNNEDDSPSRKKRKL